jgi:hypothetical protein
MAPDSSASSTPASSFFSSLPFPFHQQQQQQQLEEQHEQQQEEQQQHEEQPQLLDQQLSQQQLSPEWLEQQATDLQYNFDRSGAFFGTSDYEYNHPYDHYQHHQQQQRQEDQEQQEQEQQQPPPRPSLFSSMLGAGRRVLPRRLQRQYPTNTPRVWRTPLLSTSLAAEEWAKQKVQRLSDWLADDFNFRGIILG